MDLVQPVLPRMRQQESALGRGALLAVVTTAALFAIVAVSAPDHAALQQVQLAQPLPAWSAGPAGQQHTLRSQVRGSAVCSPASEHADNRRGGAARAHVTWLSCRSSRRPCRRSTQRRPSLWLLGLLGLLWLLWLLRLPLVSPRSRPWPQWPRSRPHRRSQPRLLLLSLPPPLPRSPPLPWQQRLLARLPPWPTPLSKLRRLPLRS